MVLSGAGPTSTKNPAWQRMVWKRPMLTMQKIKNYQMVQNTLVCVTTLVLNDTNTGTHGLVSVMSCEPMRLTCQQPFSAGPAHTGLPTA
eukprot:1160540-Pelagomonas_calceolata.AAC.4